MSRAAVLSALLLAGLLAGCDYSESDYSPTSQLVDDVLTLSTASGAASLTADGFSRLQLVVELRHDPAFSRRTVVFATTNGTLDGGQAVNDCAGCRKVEAGGDRRAVIDLVSSQRVGTAVVTAWPEDNPGIRAQLSIRFEAAQPDDTIRFVAAPARAPADGATLTTYTVEVSASLPKPAKVTFTATGASFSNGQPSFEANVDAGNRASADLKSPAQIGTGRVQATVNGVTREVPVHFERALPHAIVVTANPDSVPAAAASKVTITATLLRDVGSVTDGTLVTFSAPVGRFTNVTRTTSQVATADYYPGAAAPQLVTVTVGAQDTSVTGTVVVELTAAGGT